ncbi:MAG: radical SAM protein [Oscillospiraceae bacterium]|jgi:biotin synthase-related radical SAM superfamily protein|nr:radical SAM protein [Oscillospiraceae bacterium]
MENPIKKLLAGKVASKIKDALPLDAGDAALNGLIGTLIANPGRTEQVFGTGEIFLIKAALYLTGVRLEPSAYVGVGTIHKELIGVYQFDLNLGKTDDRPPLPSELALPHGLHVPIVVNDASPFSLLREKGTLYLKVSGMKLFPVEYEKRPLFYDKKTSDGIEMWKLAQHRLGDELMVTYNTYCHTLKGGNQCRFCGLNQNEPIHRRKNSYFIQTPEQIAEIAEAAYGEGIAKRLEITGGILPKRAEVDFIIAVGNAVKARLGTKTVPGGHALLAAPNDLSQIDRLKEAGWEYVFFNLEVWNPHFFAGLCPGKEAIVGREHWLKALDYAVEVFGKGNVRSILIAGLEPLNSYLEGAEYLTEHGIFADPSPWMPMPGSLMEGQSTPSAGWHINLLVQTLDLWERHGWDLRDVAKDGWLSFNDLAAMRLQVRRAKEDNPALDLEKDLRYQLSVKGNLDF